MTDFKPGDRRKTAKTIQDQRWDQAVDWLLTNAEYDTQVVFWAYADGKISREELDRFTTTDVVAREAELDSAAVRQGAL